MHARILVITILLVAAVDISIGTNILGQQANAQEDPVRELVRRLSLENYTATLKGLTQFGDRRQGTQRNRDAVDWIEAQLQSFGCTNTERITYMYPPEPTNTQPSAGGGRNRSREGGRRTPSDETSLTLSLIHI